MANTLQVVVDEFWDNIRSVTQVWIWRDYFRFIMYIMYIMMNFLMKFQTVELSKQICYSLLEGKPRNIMWIVSMMKTAEA